MLKKLANSIFPDAYPRIHASLDLKSKKKDIVVILGWGGGRQRNLKKLITYYQTKDVTVVSSVMPQFVPTFVRSYYEHKIASSVQQIRLEADVPAESKLFCHIFSNNGAWSFSTLCRRKELPQFDRLLIDSAPAFAYKRISTSNEVNLISRVLTSVILQRPQYEHPVDIPIRAILYIFIPTWRLINHVQKFVGLDILPDYPDLSNYMRENSPNVPTLFIYSIGDKLVPFEKVREFKTALKDRGVPTSELVFGVEVAHTAGFFKYPDEYIEVLEKHFVLKSCPADLST
jgi:Eukaryotic protein of unknown function (DUF829)